MINHIYRSHINPRHRRGSVAESTCYRGVVFRSNQKLATAPVGKIKIDYLSRDRSFGVGLILRVIQDEEGQPSS